MCLVVACSVLFVFVVVCPLFPIRFAVAVCLKVFVCLLHFFCVCVAR